MNSLRLFNRQVAAVSNTFKRVLSTESENISTERPKTERSVNKVTLMGRVGREGDIRGTTEHPCVIFPLATSLSYRKAATGEYMTRTDWHRICVFHPGLRNLASTIGKGDRIYVEGSLSQQKFMDDTNRSVNITSIIADDIIFLKRKQQWNDQGDFED